MPITNEGRFASDSLILARSAEFQFTKGEIAGYFIEGLRILLVSIDEGVDIGFFGDLGKPVLL